MLLKNLYKIFYYSVSGLACLIRKDFIKIFEDVFDLSLTWKTNLKAINFLDVKNIRSHLQQQKNVSTVTNNTKNRKRKTAWFNHRSQQISVKNSAACWVNISQKRISFINCSTVIESRLVIVLFLTLKV